MAKTGGRGRSASKRKRKKGREALWWYKAGWRGVHLDGEAILWRTRRWSPITEVTTVSLLGVPQAGWLPLVGEHLMGLSKTKARKIEGEVIAVADEASTKKWPNLVEHLTATVWDDLTTRQTSTVSIFTGDGCYKALLKDREAGVVLWVACPSLVKLFDVLEAALNDPNAVWRRDRNGPGEKASRVKGRTA